MLAELQASLGDHERGLFHLARGSGGGLARYLFEKHLAESSQSAAVWSDLSAALLVEAPDAGEWKSLEAAIVAAEKALAIDDGYVRALFNQALALEKLSLNEKAIEVWSKYIELTDHWENEVAARMQRLDGASPEPGSDEFVARVAQLDERSLSRLALQRPSRIRRLLDSETELYAMIARGADMFCANDAQNWQILGNVILAEYGDALLADTMQWLCDRASEDEEAIEGLRLLTAAIQWWRGAAEADRALDKVVQAEAKLTAARSPLVDVARVLHASILFTEQRYSQVKEILEPHQGRINRRYPFLGARIHRIFGAIEVRSLEYELAVRHYRQGAALLAGGGDPESFVRIKSLAAEAYAAAGRYDDAWREGLAALREARDTRLSSDALSGACEFLSLIAAESDAPHLQELFAGCSIHHLAAETNPTIIASAYMMRAQARTLLGDLEGANDDLLFAHSAAKSIEDASTQAYILRHVDLYNGLNKTTHAPLESIELLTGARDYFNRHDNQELEVRAGVGILEAYSNLDEAEKASEQLDNLGKLALEAQRSADSTRFSFPIHEHYRPIINRRIKSRLSSGDGFGGLQALVEARLARSLSVHDLQNLLRRAAVQQDGDAILILAWLDDGIAGWLIDDVGIATWFHTPITSGRVLIQRAAGTHLTPFAHGQIGALGELYDALIAPIEDDLGGFNTLRIIPDDLLFGIPYPALWNARAERYLVEDFALTVSPELVFTDREPELDLSIESVAVFVAGTPDTGTYLPATSIESTRIASTFGPFAAVTTFSDEDATSSNFFHSLESYDLLHFAGHGEVDLKDPLRSRLLLNGSNVSGRTSITAEELYSHEPSRMPQLIVLAACDTAAYTNRLPQALSVVRPLLDLGAREIIGSLRPVPDEDFLQLMELFYGELSRKGNATDALRAAQIRMAHDNRHRVPGHWAYIQNYSYF